MSKVNNHFIAENRRNYERSPEQAEDGSVLFGQQSFQPAINANNRVIGENSRDYERGIPQQYDYGAANGLQVPNE